MRALALFTIAVGLLGSGCMTHRFLGRNVTKQTATVSTLLQQQVLNNVALFAYNRDALPSFSTIGDGTTQTQDSGFAQPTSMWNATAFTGINLPVQAQRQLMENWKLQPVMSAGRLLRMRCAFQLLFDRPVIALGADGLSVCTTGGCTNCVQELVKVQLLPTPSSVVPDGTSLSDKPEAGCWRFADPADAQMYAEALQKSLDCVIPTGWFCVGPKAPRDASCFGSCTDMQAWVAPGGGDGFTRFTLTILALATLDPPPKRPEMTIFLERKAQLQAVLQQLQGEVGKRAAAPNAPELQNTITELSQAIQSSNVTNERKAQLQQQLAQLKSNVMASQAVDATDTRIKTLIERAETALMNMPATPTVDPTSAFDRAGSMPMSRGGGIEYAPLAAPAAP